MFWHCALQVQYTEHLTLVRTQIHILHFRRHPHLTEMSAQSNMVSSQAHPSISSSNLQETVDLDLVLWLVSKRHQQSMRFSLFSAPVLPLSTSINRQTNVKLFFSCVFKARWILQRGLFQSKRVRSWCVRPFGRSAVRKRYFSFNFDSIASKFHTI